MPHITREVSVYVDGDDLGRMFASLDSDEMAEFFNAVADVAAQWKSPNAFYGQVLNIRDSEDLTDDGRAVLNAIRDAMTEQAEAA